MVHGDCGVRRLIFQNKNRTQLGNLHWSIEHEAQSKRQGGQKQSTNHIKIQEEGGGV